MVYILTFYNVNIINTKMNYVIRINDVFKVVIVLQYIEKDEISPCLHFYDLVLRWNIYLKRVILYLFSSSKPGKIPLNSLHKQMDT